MPIQTSQTCFSAGIRKYRVLVSMLALAATTLIAGCSTNSSSDGESDIATSQRALDSDGDGICNPGLSEPAGSCTGSDNCPFTANPSQDNLDGDRAGDACDPDVDGDGVPNAVDNCPLNANALVNGVQPDLDGDGVGDACEDDMDGDGIPDDGDGSGIAGDAYCTGGNVVNCDDNCPRVPNPMQADANGDGVGDDCDEDEDNDGIIDSEDNCPTTPNPNQENSDGDDTQGDACDYDRDNDGVCDPGSPQVGCVGNDNCPDTSNAYITCVNGDPVMGDTYCGMWAAGTCGPDDRCTLQADLDGDGRGNACDLDDDADGIPDMSDNCPNTANNDQADTDGDGVGNACSDDIDGDGIINAQDNCVLVINPDQADSDGNGYGDACDDDMDGDGRADIEDNCPTIPNYDQANVDGDSMGDACDPDIDNDTVLNANDNCPYDSNPNQANMDGDQFGDVCDLDRDGDGYDNVADNCPDTSNPTQADADGDGVGDACDDDGDNDGIPDATDNCPTVFNPGQEDLDDDGLGDLCDDDADGDGETRAAGDCCDLGTEAPPNVICNDTTAAAINTSAVEICDRLDNNCSGTVDEGVDDDLDGWADAASGQTCPTSLGGAGDCDDTNPSINPGAAEVCNGLDDDCDTQIDEGGVCTAPGMEICNGLDDDGNGVPDDIFACVQNTVVSCTTSCMTVGTAQCDANCTLGICQPPAEACTNAVDDDCDGLVDCFDPDCAGVGPCAGCTDADNDGFFAEAGCGTLVDCFPADPTRYPGGPEVCGDGVDDNCNGVADDGCSGCLPTEICGNLIDDDCDGLVDENCGNMTNITFAFTGPAVYGGSYSYLGGAIWIEGYVPGLMSWGTICSAAMDTNASPTDFACLVSLPTGYNLVFQVYMTVSGSPPGTIYWGDQSYTNYGGHGSNQGTITVNGGAVPVTLIQAPAYSDPNPTQHGEIGELLVYNGQIAIP